MSPIVEDGQCIVHVGPSTNGAVVSFDLAGGAPKWKWDGDGPANSSPVIMTVGGKKQLVIFTGKYLVGLDLADGKLLWQVPFEANQGINATPVVAGMTVLLHRPGQGTGSHEDRATRRQLHRDAPVEHSEVPSALHLALLRTASFTAPTTDIFSAPMPGPARRFGTRTPSWATPPPWWTQARSCSRSAPAANCSPSSPNPPSPARIGAIHGGRHRDMVTDPVIAGNRIFVKDNETVSLWGLEAFIPAGGPGPPQTALSCSVQPLAHRFGRGPTLHRPTVKSILPRCRSAEFTPSPICHTN